MAWRPQIPEPLEERIEEVAEEEGFQTKSEYVRFVLRSHLDSRDNRRQTDEGTEESIKNLKETVFDDEKIFSEKRDAIELLGNFGEDAVTALTNISQNSSDQTLRNNARDELEEITGE